MPTTVTLYLIGVWFCVGFFTGVGWALGVWVVGQVVTLARRAAAPPKQDGQ